MFATTKRYILLAVLALACTLPAYTQQRTTTGVVVTSENKPVVGANVVVEGTTQGTVTDIDGRFELKTSPSDVLIITIPGRVKKLYYANRLCVWGDIGATSTPDVWKRTEMDEYCFVGGGAGIGYQRVNNSLLITVGIEFRSLNYSRFFSTYKLDGKDEKVNASKMVNSGFIQIPVMLGMEINHFYWMLGAKVGTALYNNYGNIAFNKKNSEYKFVRVAPALEIGASFTQSKPTTFRKQEATLHTNYKVGFCMEWGFEMVHQGNIPPLGTCDWTNAMLGLKFSVGFFNEIKSNPNELP